MGSLGSRAVKSEYTHPLISERALDEPRPLKVIYIGAGVSGICAAIQFPKYVPTVDLTVYEKNADVGGTWFENRYPGCACDIPAHAYQLSFESWTNWSKFYAGAAEILQYWKRVAEKYNVKKYMKFSHRCVEARWNEETSKWHVKIEDVEKGEIFDDCCDVFATGTGGLNEWKWPDVKGLHEFKGDLLHSANWDTEFDATNKTVAVIGAGSSGIQIVPTLKPFIKSMDHYVRGRTWIAATFGNELVRERNDGEDGNFAYTDEEKAQWREDPESYRRYRKMLEAAMQGTYAVTHRGTPEQDGARMTFDKDMRKRLSRKPEIVDHLLPDFPPICKRLTPGPGYLEALTADNVNVIPTTISHVDETGITTTDGKHRPVDAIVCATGFDTSFRSDRMPIYGRGGIRLADRWRQRPETYLSMCTDGFPNLFQSLGPNAGLGNGNLIIIIEAIQLYVAQVLRKMSIENVKTIEPKASKVKAFTDYCDAYFKRTVFSAECGSWYKSSPPGTSVEDKKKGRITAVWPGSSLHAVRTLERPRWEDYDFTLYDGNEMGWFGDGWTVAERTKDAEGLSWYLNESRMLHLSLEEENEQRKLAEGMDGVTAQTGKEDGGKTMGKEVDGHLDVPGSILST